MVIVLFLKPYRSYIEKRSTKDFDMPQRMPLKICFAVTSLLTMFKTIELDTQKMICSVLRKKSAPGYIYQEVLSGISVRWEHHGSTISIVALGFLSK
jgi:hypothetical protein